MSNGGPLVVYGSFSQVTPLEGVPALFFWALTRLLHARAYNLVLEPSQKGVTCGEARLLSPDTP